MPCTLPNTGSRFDKVAKALATGVSRRDAFKFVGAGVLGAMLASVGVRNAEAARVRCQTGTCGQCPPITGCQGHDTSGDQCICLQKYNVNKGGCLGADRAKCVQNAFCNTLVLCDKTRTCRTQLGDNWKCTDGACCNVIGVCTALCATVPPCCSAQGGKGASLATLGG